MTMTVDAYNEEGKWLWAAQYDEESGDSLSGIKWGAPSLIGRARLVETAHRIVRSDGYVLKDRDGATEFSDNESVPIQ